MHGIEGSLIVPKLFGRMRADHILLFVEVEVHFAPFVTIDHPSSLLKLSSTVTEISLGLR
jgi:hypothetical protein